MIKSLDINYLIKILCKEYQNLENSETLEGGIREAFDIYILLATLGNDDSSISEQLKSSKNKQQ